MNPILKLIRWPNLAVIVLMQWLLYYNFIARALAAHDLRPDLSYNMAILFIAVTALLTAGGYIINDLSDVKADEINRAGRMVVGRQLSVSVVKWLYFVSVAAGYVLALYIALRQGKPGLIVYYLFFAAGLYLYSRYLKRLPFVGNLWVALYCAGAIGMLWFAERHACDDLMHIAPETAGNLQSVLLFFMAFAFLSTVLREVVKDMQDEPGDRPCGYRTAPVVWGMTVSRNIALAAAGLMAILIVVAVFGLKPLWNNLFAPAWLGLVFLLLLLTVVLLIKSKTPVAFRRVSLLIKAVMLGGILWLLFLHI